MSILSGRRLKLVGAVLLLAPSIVVAGVAPDAAASSDPYPVTATIPVGRGPGDVAVDSDARTVYVTNQTDNTVSAISEDSNTVVATIAVGSAPVAVATDPGLHAVYVANSSDDTISIIDDRTNIVSRTLPLTGSPSDIAADPSTHNVYVSEFAASAVQAMTAPGYVMTSISVENPQSLAVDTVRHTVFMAGQFSSGAVIDETTNSVVYPAPIRGYDVAVDSLAGLVFTSGGPGGYGYVYNEVTGGVSSGFGFPFHHGENFPTYSVAVDPGTDAVFMSNSYGGTTVFDEESHGVIGSVGGNNHVAIDPVTHNVYGINADINDAPVQQAVVVTAQSPQPRPGISLSLSDNAIGHAQSVTVPDGTPVSASVSLFGPGAATATGTVTYRLFDADNCFSSDGYFSSSTVVVSHGSVPASDPVRVLDYPGDYYWSASYSGDDTHARTSTGCNAGRETVTGPYTYHPDSADFATPGNILTVASEYGGLVGHGIALAFIEADGPDTVAQQVTGVSGGGLTWRRAAAANRTGGTTEVWWAEQSTFYTADITATLAQPAHGSITVEYVETPARQIGKVAMRSGTSGTPRITITPSNPGSLVLAAGHDWTHARPITAPSGQQLLHLDRDASVGDSFWAQRISEPTPDTSPVRIASRGPVGDRWTMAAVEIPAG